jgi:hypothetical protein
MSSENKFVIRGMGFGFLLGLVAQPLLIKPVVRSHERIKPIEIIKSVDNCTNDTLFIYKLK